ncbi:MAG: hypothetical protein ABIK97_04735 [candidate division WOR-3 bacterium]
MKGLFNQKSKWRFFWIGATFVLLVLNIFLLLKNLSFQRRLFNLQEGEKRLKREIGDLKNLLKEKEILLENQPKLNRWEIEELKRKGLKDPVSEIIADLKRRKELIPYKAVLGGKMYFCEVYVLNGRWVLASFEDGHIMGRMLLRYSVGNNGKISWRVIDSYLE